MHSNRFDHTWAVSKPLKVFTIRMAARFHTYRLPFIFNFIVILIFVFRFFLILNPLALLFDTVVNSCHICATPNNNLSI